ncbi:MAG: metal ABC transporter permease [Corynebacterium sp.]|uniref:metal ABC transporter permease n=1 Tax=unclassified Corynebacterium TaxID=2624378 RepID=UPI00264A4DA6|nr:metal ABC transporter permease [Corynebacterium sp.]MDN5582719.1 metal ABC transporter permease [Corynebacterium sp.]MDN5719852.1 metal ABC transporter permease [Corynebacterium sp.]MDN6259901.1 metal ABC transporter permease [Corynebacterium sp.]MDN6325712.1 metal ABC transporter permease [Corynebacterium sp.]MDN6510899.1 metal ABC transporter permease [Corynebacterium sp.]
MSTWDLLQVDFVQNALLASLLLGLVSGALAPLIVMRRMSFAAHATGELALMGAAAALLFGVSVTTGAVLGAVLAAVVLALLGLKEQDATVGVVLAFGMGLSVLFIYLYPGRTSEAYALLTGQIVGVSGASLGILALMSVLVAAAVAVLWRPLLFATVDPVMAAASGVPVKLLAAAFAVLIGIVASQGVQIVGALLLLALLITPGAAAVRVTSNPLLAVVLSAIFATTASAGGLVLSLAPGLPVSPFVTTISFVIYLACRTIGWARGRRAVRDETARKGSAVGAVPGSTGEVADPHHAAP